MVVRSALCHRQMGRSETLFVLSAVVCIKQIISRDRYNVQLHCLINNQWFSNFIYPPMILIVELISIPIIDIGECKCKYIGEGK